ncbi:MAG: uracil-DNA glycosylase [Christensenellaceae bacterium]|jgi:uracil-DNA glycosylase|nr:uracil-DNA glycosylase [Christensenellaceae bacterium]
MQLNMKWKEALAPYRDPAAFRELFDKLCAEYKYHKICPKEDAIFRAFDLCQKENVKVVILGQDPYFNEGQATGLAFSINPDDVLNKKITFPPTLRNIIQEVEAEFGSCMANDGNLDVWAEQGVLLLNTCLTVRQGFPLSHKNLGWNSFIDAVLKLLNSMDNLVFLLWGSNAKSYRPLFTNPKNIIFACAHPSPLSASMGFFGCEHFKRANEFLVKCGKTEIKW